MNHQPQEGAIVCKRRTGRYGGNRRGSGSLGDFLLERNRFSKRQAVEGKDRMSERLIVKNFLCLEDIDIEVKDFLILIGPQTAGKSLCVKLLYFFRTIIEESALYHVRSAFGSLSDLNKFLSDKFESFFPKNYWAEQNFHIECKDREKTYFKITKEEHGELSLYLNKKFLEATQELT
jgi:hypothetical protein